jgi:hypothetical protein
VAGVSEEERVAEILEEAYRNWSRALELLQLLENIAVQKCLKKHLDEGSATAHYDDDFLPLYSVEPRGYAEFHWWVTRIGERARLVKARIYLNGRVECIEE